MSTVSQTRRVAHRPIERLAIVVTALCTLVAIAVAVVLFTLPGSSGPSTTNRGVSAGYPLVYYGTGAAPPPRAQAPLYPNHRSSFGPVH